MKKYKALIILSSVLVILTALYLGITLSGSLDGENDTDTGAETEAQTYPVASLDPDTLTHISYTYGESRYSYHLNEDETLWICEENPDLILDNTYFANMASAFIELTSTVKLEGITDEERYEYGLETPTAVIEFTDSKNGSLCFSVGIKNTYNGKYYISESGSNSTAYMIDAAVLELFQKTPDDMIKHDTLPTVSAADILSARIEKGEDVYLYTYSEEDSDGSADKKIGRFMLSVNGGEAYFPGDEISGGLISAITEMEFKDFMTYDRGSFAEYGLDSPTRITLTYKVSGGTQGQADVPKLEESTVILLGSPAENGLFYAKLESSPYVYTLSPAIFGNLTDAKTQAQ